ncbi:MAG: chain-length determining protein [Prevotella sp.]|nr:chain-length determining protein [Prevotella sp.]
MEETKNQKTIIDIQSIISTLRTKKRKFYIILPFVFLFSCIYIFSLPRYYTTDAKLAPEMGGAASGGTLGSIASAFGFNIGDMQTTDAITPLLYPDLLDDNAFVTNLFPIQIETKDGEIKTSYYEYLKRHQKKAWWSSLFSFLKSNSSEDKSEGEFNPYSLSKEDAKIVNLIRKNIRLSVDKKTGVITVEVQDQDPRVCKTITDSVMGTLQTFITEYRTTKSRTDYEYYKNLTEEARLDYEKTLKDYALLADANSHASLRSVQLQMDYLENDMQLKFTTYQTLNTQLQAANAKVQERTPVFTILKGAEIPIRPAGPKRMLFVLGMMILASFFISAYILLKESHAPHNEANANKES